MLDKCLGLQSSAIHTNITKVLILITSQARTLKQHFTPATSYEYNHIRKFTFKVCQAAHLLWETVLKILNTNKSSEKAPWLKEQKDWRDFKRYKTTWRVTIIQENCRDKTQTKSNKIRRNLQLSPIMMDIYKWSKTTECRNTRREDVTQTPTWMWYGKIKELKFYITETMTNCLTFMEVKIIEISWMWLEAR